MSQMSLVMTERDLLQIVGKLFSQKEIVKVLNN